MNWFEYLLYGFVSGVSELLPISSYAHQTVFKEFFGVFGKNAYQDLFVHLSVFGTILFIYHTQIVSRQRHHSSADRRHLKTALVPVLVGAILYPILAPWGINYLLLSLLLLINGVLLYIPSRIVRGNKDAAFMSGFDSLLVGTGAALGAFPGLSHIAGILSLSTIRGAESRNAFRWAVYLSMPVLCVMMINDLLMIGTATYSVHFIGVLLSMIGAIIGTFISYSIMRFLAQKSGFAWFSYYSWGAALFIFVLYLLV